MMCWKTITLRKNHWKIVYIENNILNVQTNEFAYIQKLLSYKTTNIEKLLDI
jgi:hypothetical protein